MAMAMVAVLSGACTQWRSAVTLHRTYDPACAATRHDIAERAREIPEPHERLRMLETMPDCSADANVDRTWTEVRDGRCAEHLEQPARTEVVQCEDRRRVRVWRTVGGVVGLAVAAFVALEVALFVNSHALTFDGGM